MKPPKENVLIDTTLIMRYVTLQHYHKELWKDYVELFKENEELRGELNMKRRLYELPRYVKV